jgi:GNAT superfamily N-acetyltransferase
VQVVSADGFVADDDPGRLDLDVIHASLRTTYWAPNVPRAVVERSLANSLVLGLYTPDGAQVGMARAVTDRATFAWIADVFVLPEHRGGGHGTFLVSTLLEHPDLQGLRRVMLATADAHELYRKFGFAELARPDSYLVVQQNPVDLYGT